MTEIVRSNEVTPRDLARGRNLRIGAVAAPIVFTALPLIVFLILSVVLSGAPIFAVSSFLLGLVLALIGFVVGLGISGFLVVRHQKWTAEMRERIAANGIGANEIDWFRKELKPSEKRALKVLKAADPLMEDAYRETLASRLTATRIVRSSKRELSLAKRREAKVKMLRAENSPRFLEQIRKDTAKIDSINTEAKQMLAEAESRLQMIEAAASRGGNLADSELALKKLASRASQLPLALEAARVHEEILAELQIEGEETPEDEISS
ncbi:MAG TPA: hypothetical protein VK612_05220 [Pyrinomonadaceae bacterium]|nr:hypothetical protein [Pyrinomonadaceae bacterium]